MPPCLPLVDQEALLNVESKIQVVAQDLADARADLDICSIDVTAQAAAHDFDREAFGKLSGQVTVAMAQIQELFVTVHSLISDKAPVKMVNLIKKEVAALGKHASQRLESLEARVGSLMPRQSPSAFGGESFVSSSHGGSTSAVFELSADEGLFGGNSTFDDSFVGLDPTSSPPLPGPARPSFPPALSSPTLEPPTAFDYSHGPVLVGGALQWRFTAIFSEGIAAATLTVNLAICSDLPPPPTIEPPLSGEEFKAHDWEPPEVVPIPKGCSVEYFREFRITGEGPCVLQVGPASRGGWYRGIDSKLTREDLLIPLAPIDQEDCYMEPLHPRFLDSLLCAALRYAHLELPGALEAVRHALSWQPAPFEMSGTDCDTMQVNFRPPSPAMLRILLLPLSDLSASCETFVGAVRDLLVTANWEVPAAVWRELGAGQRKNCGVLVGVLSLISNDAPKPIFNGLSRASDKQRKAIATAIHQTFLGSSAEMDQICEYVNLSSIPALSNLSVWADEPLLASLPTRRVISLEEEMDFCFPVWQTLADAKATAKAGGVATLLWPGVRGTTIGAPVSVACLLEMISLERRVLLVSQKLTVRALANPGRQATACRISSLELDVECLHNILLSAVQDFRDEQLSFLGEVAFTEDPFVALPPPGFTNFLSNA